MKYQNHRTEPHFTFLKEGLKTIDGRLREGWYCQVKPGDEIQVMSQRNNDSVLVRVKRVAKYSSISEMLTKEPLTKW